MEKTVAKNRMEESLPVLIAETSGAVIVDGSLAAAACSPRIKGIYRIAVMTSVSSAGANLQITIAGTVATAITGMWIGHNAVEYVYCEEGSIISVINGKINITRCS